MTAASTLVTSGTRRRLKRGGAQICFQALLRGLHQRAVKGSGNRQHHGALGAACEAMLHGALHRRGIAGNHRLLGGIQIRRSDHLSVARPCLQISATWPGASPGSPPSRLRPAGTASCIYWPRAAHQPHGVGKFKRAAATSAEYSPRLWPATNSGAMPLFLQHAIRGHGNRQNRGLRVFGQLQRLFGAFKAQFGNGKSQRLVGFVEDGASRGKDSASSRPMPGYCDP